MTADTPLYLAFVGLLLAAGAVGWYHESARASERVEVAAMIIVPWVFIVVIMIIVFWGDAASILRWSLGGTVLVLVLSQGSLVLWGMVEHRDVLAGYRVLFLPGAGERDGCDGEDD